MNAPVQMTELQLQDVKQKSGFQLDKKRQPTHKNATFGEKLPVGLLWKFAFIE